MTTVGIRELKAHLSEYIRLASRGETVVVTHRGKDVVVMHAPDAEHDGLRRLMESGMVKWSGGKPKGPTGPPIDQHGRTDLEDRRSTSATTTVILYLDTSSLLKHYLESPASTPSRMWITAPTWSRRHAPRFAETAAALSRRPRGPGPSRQRRRTAHGRPGEGLGRVPSPSSSMSIGRCPLALRRRLRGYRLPCSSRRRSP